MKYNLVHINESQDGLLASFEGRWGQPPNLESPSTGLIKTPEGPPLRAAKGPDGNPVYLLTMPRQLHNLARKKDYSGDGTHEPQFDKMCIKPCQ